MADDAALRVVTRMLGRGPNVGRERGEQVVSNLIAH